MLEINWTARFRWVPEVRLHQAPDMWCLEIKWLGLQISLYNHAAAEAVIDLFNASVQQNV